MIELRDVQDVMLAASKLMRLGLVPESRLRRLEIHTSYWILRDGGTSPGDAMMLVARQFQVSEDTVQIYSRRKDRYEPDDSEPQS